LHQQLATISQLQSSIEELQLQAEAESQILRTQIKDMQDNLETEKRRTLLLQNELVAKSQELSNFKEDIRKQTTELRATIALKDDELVKLKKQVLISLGMKLNLIGNLDCGKII
jgi:DNA gyrase/topoisomerase IV subunit A